VLFATSIVALPAVPRAADRRRAARQRQSLPISPVESVLIGDTTTQYSDNWSGAVITSPPSGTTFTAVSGVFTVPQPTAPSTTAGSYSAAAWVGIDGDTYTKAILQAGVDFTATVSSAGKVTYSYDAWYEWYPQVSHDFSDFTFTAGDVISVSVTATSTTTGNVILENMTTGKTVTEAVSARTSASALGGQNAEWIVEDFEEGGSLVSLVNFGTVEFSECVATTSSGSTEGPTSATIIDIGSKADPETAVTLGSTTVTVEYIG